MKKNQHPKMEKIMAFREQSCLSLKIITLVRLAIPSLDMATTPANVFIVPGTSSIQRLDDIKKQMETLQQSIADKQQKGLAVTDGEKDSLAFLRAQHDNLSLWQRTLVPCSFPGGTTIVNQSGQAVYTAQLSNDAQPQPPSFPDIEPIKTIYPIRRATARASPNANVIVSTLNPKQRKGGKRLVPPPAKQQEVVSARRGKKLVSGLQETLGYQMMNGNAVILEPNGAVRINGTLFVAEAFRWWKDLNGNRFFVYIPASLWDRVTQAWSMRILFSVPGMHAFYSGFVTDPCFEKVGTLHVLVENLLSRMWYVQVSASKQAISRFPVIAYTLLWQNGAVYPRATAHHIQSDVKHFPLPKKFAGYRKGDEVYVRRGSFHHGFIRDVYVLPDKARVYLVLAACAEIPDFRLGISPWMETLTEDDLCPPRVYWKSIHPNARSARSRSTHARTLF